MTNKNQTSPPRWARTLRRLHSLWFCLLAVMLLVTNKSMAVIYQVGTGTVNNTTSGITPYTTYWQDNRIQYLYLASELTGLGASTGNITSVAFNFTSLGSPTPANVNIKIGLIPAGTTNINSLTLSGLTNVYSAATVTPTLGWNTYILSTPFLWDGTSNVLVEVCRDNAFYGTSYGVQCTNLGAGVSRTFGYYNDGVAGCSMTSGGSASALNRQNRPNMQFDISPPPSCLPPTSPIGSASSATSANISWTAPGSPPSNGYQYAVTTSAT
ncbi:MAG: PKD domain-containing protein, partial [Bacteroidetes bacterium OLB10]